MLPGHQLGIRTMSAVAYLREELRLPVNLVQRYLGRAGLLVSSGEIELICTEVAEHLPPCLGVGEGLLGEPLHSLAIAQGSRRARPSQDPLPTHAAGGGFAPKPPPAQFMGRRLPARPLSFTSPPQGERVG